MRKNNCKTAFVNVNLIDGILNCKGNMSVKKGTVIIENGRFISVCEESADLRGCKVTDLNGAYMIPGLINLHVHLPLAGNPEKPSKPNAKPKDYKKLFDVLSKHRLVLAVLMKMQEKNARTQLLSGVTTIRTVGGILNLDSKVRDRIDCGKATGPRILAANTAVSVTGGHFAGSLATESDTPSDAAEAVRKIASSGADVIKLMITGGVMDASVDGEPGILRMAPEIIKAACDEAHSLGLKVAAHVEGREGLVAALENGVDTIEHGSFQNEKTIGLFKKTGAVDVCTLSPAIPCAMFSDRIPVGSPVSRRNSNTVLEGVIDCAKKCIENNIPVGLGTDSGCPFTTQYNTWRELEYWTLMLGASSDFALYSATLGNAKIAGIDNESGSIERNKSADFVIVKSNPLENLKTLSRPLFVGVRGSIIRNPHIRKNRKAEAEFDYITASLRSGKT